MFRGRTFLRLLALFSGLLLAGLLIGGQMGWFSGTRPADLGVRDGQLKPAPATPNGVSSQAAGGAAQIAPIAYAGDAVAALARLRDVVGALPGARIIETRDDYLYAEFTSRWLGFVDDVEFAVGAVGAADGVIHVRSASRLGRSDFGVNRARVEDIRRRFLAAEAVNAESRS